MRLAPKARHRIAVLCFGLLLPYSVFVQAMGSYSRATHDWDAIPQSINQTQWRLWDLVDNPVLRGLRGYPPAGG
jgi:hypothetical protein